MINLYVVQNKEGKYFKSRSIFDEYKEHWVDSILSAKIYHKIAQAKQQVTYFVRDYPEYETPVIIELGVCNFKIINSKTNIFKIYYNKGKSEIIKIFK